MKKVYIFSAPKDYQIRQFASYFPVLSNFVLFHRPFPHSRVICGENPTK